MLEISKIQGVITFFSGFMEIYPELCIIITKQSSKIMIDFSQFDSLIAMTMHFNNEAVCRNAIIETRWGVGEQQDVVCPYCGKHHVKMSKSGRFHCTACNKNFSCKVGTIFEDSNLSLVKWFIAMYLISSHKKGISSHQLSRDIKVTQKTAWYMLQKVRALYAQNDSEALEGEVECDEVYIGGKEKWKHKSMRTPNTQGRSTKTKTPVFGMMERSTIINAKGEEEFMSYVRAMVVEKTDKATLLPIISQFIDEGSTVFTDELNAYNKVGSMGYNHRICNHGALQFVCEDDGSVYANNIEGFWSHFRRMITGCYHDVSDEHLQPYIDEACFRWNTRKMAESERFSQIFHTSIGLVKPNREFVLCEVA